MLLLPLLWLIAKLIVLYTTAFLASVSLYFYLHRTILPPHQTLRFPVEWRENGRSALVDFEGGQRSGGNFYLRRQGEKRRSVDTNVVDLNVPYDLSLLMKYPDRPEVADFGNLQISVNLWRRDGQSAGNFHRIRSLRYDSRLLRVCRDVLRVPGAIWRDSGSERTERIGLFERLVDENGENVKRSSKDSSKFNFIENSPAASNPIAKIEVIFDKVPPLHSLELEILVNLSLLQHFLFYYRIPAAVLIVGTSTTILWIILTLYAVIELAKILIFQSEKAEQSKEESEDENSEIVDLDECTELNEILLEPVEIEFPPADSVANFIGDLRQRRKGKAEEEEGEIESVESVDEDQSVPQ